MVEAGYRLMSTRGYTATTMADIAAEAGVAVQTVYFTFHTKPAVLRAAFEFAVKGDHLPNSPVQRPWFAAMQQAPDHERALAIFVDATIPILQRVLPLAAVFSALVDDPEIATFYELTVRLQRDGYRFVVDTLARKQPLRPDLSPEDATTILLVLVGTGVYRSRRWSITAGPSRNGAPGSSPRSWKRCSARIVDGQTGREQTRC
jgi:AcrR family transcriptional regulator